MPAFDPLPPLVTGQTYDLLFTINSSLLVLTWGHYKSLHFRRSPYLQIAGNQAILHPMNPSLYAVTESTLAVGVDHLIRAVFFSHVRKAAVPLQNVGGRVVKEHYEAGIAVISCRLK